MPEVKKESMEARILDILLKIYPITVDELAKRLRVSERRVKMVLLRMERAGWLVIEPLPDKEYVRLLRMDFTFIGRREVQKRALKHKKGKTYTRKAGREKGRDDDEDGEGEDIMYG